MCFELVERWMDVRLTEKSKAMSPDPTCVVWMKFVGSPIMERSIRRLLFCKLEREDTTYHDFREWSSLFFFFLKECDLREHWRVGAVPRCSNWSTPKTPSCSNCLGPRHSAASWGRRTGAAHAGPTSVTSGGWGPPDVCHPTTVPPRDQRLTYQWILENCKTEKMNTVHG